MSESKISNTMTLFEMVYYNIPLMNQDMDIMNSYLN